MAHRLLEPRVVDEVERAAGVHAGWAWTHTGFTDLSHRAAHPCGVFLGTPFSVCAKLDSSLGGAEQFTAELNGSSGVTIVLCSFVRPSLTMLSGSPR